jgi:hypothetical protein
VLFLTRLATAQTEISENKEMKDESQSNAPCCSSQRDRHHDVDPIPGVAILLVR